MAGRLLRPAHDGARRAGSRAPPSGRFARGWCAATTARLGWVLGHALLMLLLTVATLGLTIFLAIVVPKGLFPQQDTGLISGFSEAAQDISSGGDAARAGEGERGSSRTTPTSTTRYRLRRRRAGRRQHRHGVRRRCSPTTSARAPPTRSSPACAPSCRAIPGITLFLQSVQDVRMGGRASRTQYQYALRGRRPRRAADLVAQGARAHAQGLPELRDVATDQQTAGLQLAVDIDRDSAARLGISLQTIDDTLYDAFGQRQVATSFTPLNYYRVVLEATPGAAGQPRSAGRTSTCAAPDGALVPLPSIAQVRRLADAAGGHPPGAVSRDDALVQPGTRTSRSVRRVKAIDAAERADRPAVDGARQLPGHGAGLRRLAQPASRG